MKDSLWNSFKLLARAIWAYRKKDYEKAYILATQSRSMTERVLKGKP